MNYVAGLLLLVFEDVSAAYSAFLVFMQIFALSGWGGKVYFSPVWILVNVICGKKNRILLCSGLYIEGLPLMLTYSCATLRRMKDSMPELHDHFWRVNFRFPQLLICM